MSKISEYDSKYVGFLLSIVFGDDTLKKCSARGTASNFNGASHQALDPQILKFIEGTKFDEIILVSASKNGLKSIGIILFSHFQVHSWNVLEVTPNDHKHS